MLRQRGGDAPNMSVVCTAASLGVCAPARRVPLSSPCVLLCVRDLSAYFGGQVFLGMREN